MPTTNRPAKPPDDLQSAFAQIKKKQDRAKRGGKKRGGDFKMVAQYWLKNLLILVVLVALVMLVDGIRREGKEFSASVSAVQGDVKLIAADGSAGVVTTQSVLKDGDAIETGPNGACTLVMHDGSAVQVEAGSRFVVRVLDFARNGTRDRSFLLERGAVTSRVGHLFGAESTEAVCTPGAVAAVRGTAFRVSYDPDTKSSAVQTVEGTVAWSTPTATDQAAAGQANSARGYQVGGKGVLDADAKTRLGQTKTALDALQAPPSGLQDAEWQLTSLADPVLQLLGICPGGWGYNSIDFARRSAAQEALRTLRAHVAELHEPPEVLCPWTLAELNLEGKEAKRTLTAFRGFRLDSWKKTNGAWEITATARDRRRTQYRLTEGELEKIAQP
jgi:hypothetical protein